MRKIIFLLVLVYLPVTLSAQSSESNQWIIDKHTGYDLYYTAADKEQAEECAALSDRGIIMVHEFFNAGYKSGFRIFIHPDRKSLDIQWSRDWNIPEYKSECWMVASGIASKLDLLSPLKWASEACEHVASDTIKTQQLITHELVHVFHGQFNASPDFSDVTGIDWFVEGLAAYVSGQCDQARMNDIKKAVSENSIPPNLEDFWVGRLKYGLSGSMVMYIDERFGRNILSGLLRFNRKSEILNDLNISETELLNGWKSYITSLN